MVNCVICGIRPAVGKGEHVWPAWFLKDADAAAGLVLETEERDDIYLLLEEITHVARQPSLLPEMEPWYTW